MPEVFLFSNHLITTERGLLQVYFFNQYLSIKGEVTTVAAIHLRIDHQHLTVSDWQCVTKSPQSQPPPSLLKRATVQHSSIDVI